MVKKWLKVNAPGSEGANIIWCFADFLFKFLVIGSAGVGKSCVLHQLLEKKCKYICLYNIKYYLFTYMFGADTRSILHGYLKETRAQKDLVTMHSSVDVKWCALNTEQE